MTREEAIKEMIRAYDVLDFSCHMDNRRKEAFNMAKVALEQEPCGDAISRQAVLDLPRIKTHNMWGNIIKESVDVEDVKQLPPVNPQTKTGHWIQTNESFINQDGQFIYNFICSECNSLSFFRKSNKKAIGANVCPNCGAGMVEPQERSE